MRRHRAMKASDRMTKERRSSQRHEHEAAAVVVESTRLKELCIHADVTPDSSTATTKRGDDENVHRVREED